MTAANLLAALSVVLLGLVLFVAIVDPESPGVTSLLHASLGCIGLSGCIIGGRDDLSMRTFFFIGILLFGWFGAILMSLPAYPGDFADLTEELAYLTGSVHVIWWMNRRASQSQRRTSSWTRPVKRGGVGVPLGLLLVSNFVALATAGASSSTAQISQGIALASVVYALMSVRDLRSNSSRAIITAIALLCTGLFVLTVFKGGGRLVILSLAFALVWTMVPDSRLGRRNIVLLLTVIGLPFASWIEISRGSEDFSVTQIRAEGLDQGLSSALSPLFDLGVILDDSAPGVDGSFDVIQERPQSFGRTFLVPAVAWVPRSVWPTKPVGFGRLVVEHYNPRFAALSPTHSNAPGYLGEWIYNFGKVAGFVLGSSIVGLAIRRADRARERLAQKVDATSMALHTAHILLAVNMVDYVWGGSFTYAVRGVYPAVALVLVAKVATLASRAR